MFYSVKKCWIFSVFALFFVKFTDSATFVDYFNNCHTYDSNFDNCIKDALNNVRPFFKKGVPEIGLPPFDPFFIREVAQKVGGTWLNYRLILRNVIESGWTISQVTRFRSDFNKNLIQYTQSFPDKALRGEYEFYGTVLGRKFNNKGFWNLTLYDLIQTTTVQRLPNNGTSLKSLNGPIKVSVDVQTIKDLDLHIGNLVRGFTIAENMIDRVINGMWEPGFVVIRPLINDLVSTAFTEIFSNAFNNFPFDTILK